MKSLPIIVAICSSAFAQVPTPDDKAARENLPKGAACRIGTEALDLGRDASDLFFTPAAIYAGKWGIDAKTGKQIKPLELDGVFGGFSASRTCAAFVVDGVKAGLYKLPSTKPVAVHTFADYNDSEGIIPDDSCSRAIQWNEKKRCIHLYDAAMRDAGDICPGEKMFGLAMSGDGKRIAFVPDGQSDMKIYEGKAVVTKIPGGAREPAFSRDGSLLAFFDQDKVKIVKLPRGEVVATIPTYNAEPIGLAFAKDRLAIMSPGSGEATLKVVDLTGKLLFTHTDLPTPSGPVWSADGKRLAYALGHSLRIVDGTTGADVLAPHRLISMTSSSLSPDGSKVVLSSYRHLTVWNTRDCTLVRDLPSRDKLDKLFLAGNAIIADGYPDLVRIDLATGKRVGVTPPQQVDSMAIAPNGSVFALGAEVAEATEQVQFRDPATLKVLRAVTLPKSGPIGAVEFLDPKTLYAVASGGLANGDKPTGGTTVYVIDVASAQIKRTFQIDGREQSYTLEILDGGKELEINRRRYSSNGKYLRQAPPRQERLDCGEQSCVVMQ